MKNSTSEDNVILIGKKSRERYVQACFYSLDQFDSTILKALGNWQSKAISVAETVAKRDDIQVKKMSRIEHDETVGIKIELEVLEE